MGKSLEKSAELEKLYHEFEDKIEGGYLDRAFSILRENPNIIYFMTFAEAAVHYAGLKSYNDGYGDFFRKRVDKMISQWDGDSFIYDILKNKGE